jgi:hypothetical protein
MLTEMDKVILHDTVSDTSVELAANLSLPIYDLQNWLYEFCTRLNNIYTSCGSIVMAFIVDLEASGAINLDAINTQQLVDAGKEVVIINRKHSFSISNDLVTADEIEIGNYGEKHCNIIYRLEGEILKVYINGRYKKRINIAHPISKAEVRFSKHSRSCRDYKLAIDDHSKMRLVEIMDTYWCDKQKRILKPGKTEEIFQLSLFEWLQLHIFGGQPKIETKTNAGDRTDIDIYAYNEGLHYIIEVKWLGENKSGTAHGIERIVEGIGQIKTYLDRDVGVNEACLVCYDGRIESEHLGKSQIDERIIPFKGCFKVIFLESESASRKGENYANRSKMGS